jgi:hypothetical protein
MKKWLTISLVVVAVLVLAGGGWVVRTLRPAPAL